MGMKKVVFMDGITDNLKVIGSMVYKDGFMPDTDENGNLIQSKEQAGEYIKRYRKRVQDGEILRFWIHTQISGLPSYAGFDDFINKRRQEEVDRLNEEYYGKEKYLKIKQCM
jgi:hypothetical protein